MAESDPTCRWYVAVPHAGGRYLAFIARGAVPENALPAGEVPASAGISFGPIPEAAPAPQEEIIDGVKVGLLVSKLDAYTDAEIMAKLNASPAATHERGSSLSDQSLMYSEARAAGWTRAQSLRKIATGVGVGTAAGATGLLDVAADGVLWYLDAAVSPETVTVSPPFSVPQAPVDNAPPMNP